VLEFVLLLLLLDIFRCQACYARLMNVDFILDVANYSSEHHRHRTWNRIPTMKNNLPNYDWLLYLDSDIGISNYSIHVCACSVLFLFMYVHRFTCHIYTYDNTGSCNVISLHSSEITITICTLTEYTFFSFFFGFLLVVGITRL